MGSGIWRSAAVAAALWASASTPAAAQWGPATTIGAGSSSIVTENPQWAVDVDAAGSAVTAWCDEANKPRARFRMAGGGFESTPAEIAARCHPTRVVLDRRESHAGRAIAVGVSDGQVYAAVRNPATGAWTQRQLSATDDCDFRVAGASCQAPDIAIDPATGHAIVAWLRYHDTGEGRRVVAQVTEISASTDANGAVVPVGEPLPTPSVAEPPQVALAPDLSAVVVWRGTAFNAIVASHRAGPSGAWSGLEFVADSDPNAHPDVVMDAAGAVTATYTSRNGTTCAGASSCVMTVDRSAGALGSWGPRRRLATDGVRARLVVDAAGRRTAVWTGEPGLVRAASRAGAAGDWGTLTTIAVDSGERVDVAVDAAGEVYAAWTVFGTIRASATVGQVWGEAKTIGATHPELSGPRVAAAGAGRAMAVWLGASSPYPLMGSEWTPPAAPAKPASESPPTVPADQLAGLATQADPGTWSGSPSSFAYRWLRCDTTGANCGEIDGATSQAYTPTGADAGSTLRVRVVATNGGGASDPVTSAASGVVRLVTVGAATATGGTVTAQSAAAGAQCSGAACQVPHGATVTLTAAPASGYAFDGWTGACAGQGATCTLQAGTSDLTSSPAFLGVPTVITPPTVTSRAVWGAAALGSPGGWSGSPTAFAYQWARCNGLGEDCADIPGATTATYVAKHADIGHRLVLRVVATNAAGDSAAATSAPSEVVGTVSITVTAGPGGTVQLDPTAPDAVCNAELNFCKVPYGDVVQVEATPDAGFVFLDWTGACKDQHRICETTVAPVASQPSEVKTRATFGAIPVNTVLPSLLSEPIEGRLALVDDGEWTANSTGFTYVWQRCDAAGGSCVGVPFGNKASYRPTRDDVGRTLRVHVTANNVNGFGTARSAPSPVVRHPRITANASGPGGTVTIGSLDCSRVCELPAQETAVRAIPDAGWVVERWSAPCAGEIGTVCRFVPDGDQTITVSFRPADLPEPISGPTLPSTQIVGLPTTANPGTWTHSPTSYHFTWHRCTASGSCVQIEGAGDGAQYTPVAADAGRHLRVHVVAANASGSSTRAHWAPISSAVRFVQLTAAAVPADHGKVTVKSSAGGASCTGTACSLPHGTAATLTATPASLAYWFTAWTGDCAAATSPTCQLQAGTADLNAIAKFEPATGEASELAKSIASRCTLVDLLSRCRPRVELPGPGRVTIDVLLISGARISAVNRRVLVARGRATVTRRGAARVRLRGRRAGIAAARRAGGRVVVRLRFDARSGGRTQATRRLHIRAR